MGQKYGKMAFKRLSESLVYLFNEKIKWRKMPILNPMIKTAFFTLLLFATCTKPQQVDVTKELGLKDMNPFISIGSPIDASFKNDKYQAIIKTEFNTGEGLWYARWGGWLGQDTFDFTEVNKNINWLKDNGLSPTVHMLIGPDIYMPDWLLDGNFKKAELDNMLRDMIYQIMDTNDNKNKVDIWNVINELFDDDGTYRTNMIWNKLGWEDDNSNLSGDEQINTKHPVFIRKTFNYCREKTKNKLELRDFNIESNDPQSNNDKKQRAIYQLIKHMINENIPIDALGIQGHINADLNDWHIANNTLKQAVEKFKSLGIEVYITELDVRTGTETWTTYLAEKQKEVYYNYVKQALEGGAKRISFWGIQDGFDPYWLLTEHPLPWDENLNKKRAYLGVKQALSDTK